MNKNITYNVKQSVLRAGVCLLMLSGTCAVFAQTEGEAYAAAAPAKKAPAAPQYVMKEVQGTIFDAATGQPLGGASVRALNNARYAALTDESGHYTISVPEFVGVLFVSAPDYNGLQLPLKGLNDQNGKLQSDKIKSFYADRTDMLNRHAMTVDQSSELTIENDIENQLNSSVRTINRGGMPAQGAALFMNGLNSLNGNAQPLVVIDGVIWDMQYDRTTLHDGFYNNVFNIIDTEDIESVEVVKNGTALYGARGANGVLVIKTKRGKSMVTKINIRAYGGFELQPDKLDMLNADQYRTYATEFLGTSPKAYNYFKTGSNPLFMNENPGYLYYPVYHNNTDWQKDLYHETFTQNYKVNVEGGDDVAKYKLSLGYAKSDATAKQNDFNRLNIRFNTDVVLFKNFTTGLDMSYVRNSYNLRDNGWAQDYNNRNISSPNVLGEIQTPFLDPYEYYVRYDQGQGLTLGHTMNIYSGRDYNSINNPYAFASPFGYEGFVNPYWILQNGDGDNKNYQEQTQFAINIAPKYQVNKYLTLSDRFSYMINRSNEKYFLPKDGTPEISVNGLGGVRGVLRSQFGKETTLFNDFRVDWQRHFGGHFVNLFGGFRFASYSYSDSYVAGYNNGNDKMPNMNYGLQYKTYGGTNDNWTNLTYYLNADYNFQNRYFLNVQAAMESSSRFGKQTSEGLKLAGVKWGLFPSVQAAWVMSNEKWFKVKPINYLKLSVGYDESGNDNVDYYATRTYFANMKFLDKATGLQIQNIQNPTIQWETTRRFTAALNTSLVNNRIQLGVEWYTAKTSNLLTKKAVSDITGLPSMWANEGALKNTGIEANANLVLLDTKNFKWQLGASVGHYKNKLTELPESDLNYVKTWALDQNGVKVNEQRMHGYTSNIYGQSTVLTAVGKPIGVFYGYKTAGVFATDAEASQAGKYGYLRYPTGLVQNPYRTFNAGDMHFVDVNQDGWISEADMVEIGDPNPDIFGNIYTKLNWKNFTLDVNFKYSLGNDIYNYERSQLEGMSNIYNQTTAVANRWRYAGQQTDIPHVMEKTSELWVNNERFSDRWIEDGSYLKLKKVRLTYQLPLSLSWLQGIAVWGEANNVFTVTKYLGKDPEVSCGTDVLYQGIDAGFLPTTRNFNLGVTINL